MGCVDVVGRKVLPDIMAWYDGVECCNAIGARRLDTTESGIVDVLDVIGVAVPLCNDSSVDALLSFKA